MRQILSNLAAFGTALMVVTGVVAQLHGQTPKPRAEGAAVAPAQTSTKKSGTGTGAVININTASAEQLEALPGVGAKVAARIVDYRQKKGPFKKIEELMNVQGIGEKSFLKLKPQVTVGGNAP
jgi:competence protein ComEA